MIYSNDTAIKGTPIPLKESISLYHTQNFNVSRRATYNILCLRHTPKTASRTAPQQERSSLHKDLASGALLIFLSVPGTNPCLSITFALRVEIQSPARKRSIASELLKQCRALSLPDQSYSQWDLPGELIACSHVCRKMNDGVLEKISNK